MSPLSSPSNLFGLLSSEQPLGPTPGPVPVAPAPPPVSRGKYDDSDTDMSDYDPAPENVVLPDADSDVDMDAPADDEPRVKPRPQIHRTTLKQVPAGLQFDEFKNNRYVLPKDFDGYDLTVVHREYRAKDMPNLQSFSTKQRYAQVMFHDDKFKLPGGVRRCVGSINKDNKLASKLISVSFETSTQIPSLKLHIARPDGGSVSWHVFANCLRPRIPDETDFTNDKPAGLAMTTYKDDMSEADIVAFKQKIARGHSSLTELAQAKNLMRINVHLSNTQDAFHDQDWHRRPIFTGLKDEELALIRRKGLGKPDMTTMEAWEQAVYMLDASDKLHIFQKIDCKDPAELTKFENHFFGCMHMCSAYRNFWFYQFQLQKPEPGQWNTLSSEADIYDRHCKLEDFEAPRWVVNVWQGFAAGVGAPVTKIEQIAWEAFNRKLEIFPTVKDCAFYIRLALARERDSQKKIVKENTESAKGVCKVVFASLQGIAGGWIAKIALPAATGGIAELVKPELDTRIKIAVPVPGGSRWQLSGQVIESPAVDDLEEFDWDFAARLLGPHFAKFEAGKPVDAELTFVDDTTTGDRARIATENMANTKVKRKTGVDIPSIIFRSEATIPRNLQNEGILAIAEEDLVKLETRAQDELKFNPQQVEAIKRTVCSDNGLALIYGPPGTGKTKTTVAAAYEHFRLEKKVLYACSSNKAVDTALSAYLSTASEAESQRNPASASRTVTAVRFVGGYKTYQDLKARTNNDADDWEGIANPTMLAAAKSNPANLYHVQLDTAIHAWKDDKGHTMKDDAEDYVEQLSRVKKLKVGSKSKEATKIRVLEEKLSKYFLRHEVDIVFTTCSSAPHKALYAGFEPDTVFIDEAGQATIAEMCMALDPFKESVKWLTMSGDYNQLMPVVTAKTSNEALHILEASLFRQLLVDEAKRYPHVMLTMQYRSHPDLVKWISDYFYDGKLQSHASTETNPPVAKTIRAFFAQLRGARKNNRNRIAIDVSGEDAVSVKYKSTTSFCNMAEARIIVELVKALLAFRVVCNEKERKKYAAILPRHIGIISGYKGQARLIKSLLVEAGVDLESVKVFFTEGGDVGTTWAFQGSEVDIAIITLCCNVKGNATEKLGFIATPNALCVQNSRARYFQITVGNFKGWCETIVDGNWPNKIHYKAFRGLINDFHTKGDIVSGEDVKAALLSTPRGKAPSSNSFYDAIPTLDSRQYTRDNTGALQKSSQFYDRDARRRKSKAPAHDHGPLQKALKANDGTPLDPKAKSGPSNREKKRALQRAKNAAKDKQKADNAEFQKLFDEGKRVNSERIDHAEDDLFGEDWADESTRDPTTAKAPHEKDKMDTQWS